MRGQEDDSTKGWANMLEMEWLWAEQLESKEGIVDQEWEPMGCHETMGKRSKCDQSKLGWESMMRLV